MIFVQFCPLFLFVTSKLAQVRKLKTPKKIIFLQRCKRFEPSAAIF